MDWNAMRFYEVEELIFTLTSAQTKKNICIYVPSSFLKKIFIAYEKVSKITLLVK